MTSFFRFFTVVCTCLLAASLTVGHAPEWFGAAVRHHMLLGMLSAILTVALHCLIFAIFTGSGKDTRELVQDLKLNQEYVGRVKLFRRITFPPALYCIFLLILTSVMGGALSTKGGITLRYVHLGLAWMTFLYNLKAFFIEGKAVAENAVFLERVNREATEAILANPADARSIPDVAGMIPAATETMEWGSHVYALGRFLCFMGLNVWLVFIYFRVIVGYFTMPVWPYLLSSLVFLGGGYYLRWRYHRYRPDRSLAASSH